MTESQRIQYIIDHCCFGSAVTFANSIGIDKTRLSKIVHGHLGISKLIPVILAVYTNINPEWLKTGEGYPGVLSVADIKARYEAIIAEKDAMIRSLMRVIEEKL